MNEQQTALQRVLEGISRERHDRHLWLALGRESSWLLAQHMLALQLDVRGVKPS